MSRLPCGCKGFFKPSLYTVLQNYGGICPSCHKSVKDDSLAVLSSTKYAHNDDRCSSDSNDSVKDDSWAVHSNTEYSYENDSDDSDDSDSGDSDD